MIIAEKLTQIADNEQKVYDAGYSAGQAAGGGGGYDDGFAAGKQAAYDIFWDALQNGGSPRNYAATFGAAWTSETFRPKYDIVPTSAYMMFRQNQMKVDLVEYLEKLGIVLDTSQCDNFSYMFSSSKFTRIGVIDLSASTQNLPGDSLFTSCMNLVTIDKIILKTGTRGEFSAGSFNTCQSLENLTLEGTLTTDIDLHWSTKLSKESIKNLCQVCNNNQTDMFTVTLSLAAVNKAFETIEGANDGSTSEEWLGWSGITYKDITLL